MALKREEHEQKIIEKINDSGLKMKSIKREKAIKDVVVNFKMNRDDKELFQRYAESKGSSISNEARRLIYDFLEKQGLK